MLDPATFFRVETIRDLTTAIHVVDPAIAGQLQTHVSEAIHAGKDREAVRAAWQEYTQVIAGTSHRAEEVAAASVTPQVDLISKTRSLLLDRNERKTWIESAMLEMEAPKLVRTTVLERLDDLDDIEVEFSGSKRSYFGIRFAVEEDGTPKVEIEVPNRLRVLTEKQLQLLISRAILLRYAKIHITEGNLEPLHEIAESELTKTPPVFRETQFVTELYDTLADGRFAEQSNLIPMDGGLDAAFKPEVLMNLAKAIASKDRALGADLRCIATRAQRADTSQKFILAWTAFGSAIERSTPYPENFRPVAITTLDKVLQKLGNDNPERDQVLIRAMEEIGVPDPGILLYGDSVVLQRRQGIYFKFEKSADSNISARADTSSKNNITIHIKVPGGAGSISEANLLLLTARAFALAEIRSHIPTSVYKRHAKVTKSEIRRPIPLTVMTWDRSLQLGPPKTTKAKLRSLIAGVRWLTMGSVVINPETRGKIMFGELAPRTEFRKRSREHAMAAQVRPGYSRTTMDAWMPFTTVQGVENLLFRPTKFIRISDYTFIFEVDDEQGNALNISLESGTGQSWIYTKLSSETFRQLKEKDIIDIAIRATTFTKSSRASGEEQAVVRSLQYLRDGFDLLPNVERARAALMLAYEYAKLSKEIEAGSTSVEGNVDEYVKRNFLMMLQSILTSLKLTDVDELHANWAEILGIGRWFLFDSETRADDPQMEAIPLGPIVMVNIQTSPSLITPNDWLYLASLIATNPGHAVRFALRGREISEGGAGDPSELYSSIAANVIFRGLGVYDPKARMPASIALNLPGGVPFTKNPNFASADPEDRIAYIKALKWFATANMRDDWKPRANDDAATIKSKYKDMSKAYHPDKCSDPELNMLLKTASSEHWSIVRMMHGAT